MNVRLPTKNDTGKDCEHVEHDLVQVQCQESFKSFYD